MSALDDHNRQHTYGNSLGPPTSVVGVSAQQAIDNHNRLVNEAGRRVSGSGEAPSARSGFMATLVSGGIALALAIAAYVVGGIGAVALGLLAVVAGIFGVVFLISGLIQGLKEGLSRKAR